MSINRIPRLFDKKSGSRGHQCGVGVVFGTNIEGALEVVDAIVHISRISLTWYLTTNIMKVVDIIKDGPVDQSSLIKHGE